MWSEGRSASMDGKTHNSSATDSDTGQESPHWLTTLDQVATLLFTFNTVMIMMGIGAVSHWKELRRHLKRPWACLMGLVCRFAVLPAVGFALCFAFRLPAYEALSVFILACSPGSAFSNVFTNWVDGDLPLSIISTELSSLLVLVLMPLNVWLYSSARDWTDLTAQEELLQVPYLNIVISLVFVTLPVLIGILVRHLSTKWGRYLSKVCSVLGWLGVLTCSVLVSLRYWNAIITKSSLFVVVAAALLPCSGFLVTYIIAKVLCFSHKTSRTVAIDTGCQNMPVGMCVILLSFPNPQVRGQMVLFPVLYGLCQVAEVCVFAGLFHGWVFMHRNDLKEESITSVVDNTLLTSIPVPAHKGSPQVAMTEQEVAEYVTTTTTTDPDMCSGPAQPSTLMHTNVGSRHRSPYVEWDPAESQAFLQARQITNTQPQPEWSHKYSLPSPDAQPMHQTGITVGPYSYTTHHQYHHHDDHDNVHSQGYQSYSNATTLRTDYPQRYSTDLDPPSGQVVESALYYDDSDDNFSPAISNKGIPNMFPVTESDFNTDYQSDFPTDFMSDLASGREDSPPPYGSPIPSYRTRPLDPSAVVRQEEEEDDCSTLTPTSPRSPELSPRPFAFYHQDQRLGQAQQFGTFGRR